MSSKREEEKNEKIIRGLMKLPPNRRCINCNSVGPQYVCTNFWTFVCLTCSGIHREFTHRVKSVSMSKFTTQEVNALQQGGNQRAREIYLKNWDMTRMRLPDSSNPDRIRDFIRSVYVNKKYFGERASEKPPADVESPMANESDLRRPSSYHSFSQSPPYDYQYEERRYGKHLAPAPKRLGSQRSYTGKIPSFISSPTRSAYEDRFANESSGSRFSDFSVSSDQFRFEPGPQRTSSSGSFGSFDSTSLPDTVQEQPAQLPCGPQQSVMTSSHLPPLAKPTSPSFSQQIDLFAGFDEHNVPTNKPGSAINAPNQPNKPGLVINALSQPNKPGSTFNAPSQIQPNKPAPSIDLFAGFNNQTPPVEAKNEGWANFDSPQNKQVSVQSSPVVVPTGEDLSRGKGPVTTAQVAPVKITAVTPQVTQTVHTVPTTNNERSQVWNAFGKSSGNINQPSTQLASVPNAQLSPLNELQIPVQSTIAPVPVPAKNMIALQTVSHAAVPTNQEKLEPWNAFGEISAVVPVGIETAKVTGTTGTQILVQSTMPPERAPLSDNLFTNQNWSNAPVNNVYGNAPLNNNLYGNVNAALNHDQYLKVEASGMNIVPPNIALQGMQYQTAKSTNPFDFPDESDIQPNNNIYMDMSSLQAALPAQQAPLDFYSQFYTQNPSSTYVPSIPQGGMQYLSGQAPNPQIPNLPPQSTYPSLGGNPFA